jgi:hypothetical protein
VSEPQTQGIPPAVIALSLQLAARGISVTPSQLLQLISLASALSRQLATRGVSTTPLQVLQVLLQRLQGQTVGSRVGAL